ncbi:MAG: NAD(P)-dependent oxidoreductase [Reyranellaceae bacterium]
MRVAILDDIHHAYDGTEGVRRLRARAEVRIFTGPFGEPTALAGFDAVVANRERTRFSRALLEALPDLRVIAQTGNHVYHIDMTAAAARGVMVAKATGGYSVGAAELAIGLALALMRRIPESDRALKRGEWRPPMTHVLHGKTLGLVGLGHVGRHVAGIARAFGMRVLAWSRRLDDATAAALGVEGRALDDMLRESDVVSIHATLGPETRGLIDARRLALLKPSACLINTARGAIVDEAALCDALAAGRLAGAGLDVFAEEPLPPGHPLVALPNVILTPHIGWPTDEAYADFANAAADALLAYLDGRPVPCFEERH